MPYTSSATFYRGAAGAHQGDLMEQFANVARLARMTEQPLGEAAHGVAASARDLVKVYGKGEAEVRALDGVTVDLMEGEFTAIMGPSGSGKSTLMHCLAALDTPTSGEAVVDGTSLGRLKDKDLTTLRRERVGFIFQSFNLVPTLSAEENIVLPLSLAGRKPDRAWFDQVVDAVGLRPRLGHRPSELSGGQQQRVACARALVSQPKIVFADEPTGNLDSTSSAEVLGFLRRSVDEFGQTVVMVSHDPVAASYSDRVLFLADGVVVDELRDPDRDQILVKMAQLQDVAMTKAAS
jgi:putative ABC transport system ATP-binding protein